MVPYTAHADVHRSLLTIYVALPMQQLVRRLSQPTASRGEALRISTLLKRVRSTMFFAVFCALIPSLAIAQSIRADGCISGQPCAYGVPLPPPNQDTYSVDADGCLVGQPCPYRGWRTSTKTADSPSDNFYLVKHNFDGTTDVVGSNSRTGAQWDQHYDPNLGVQSGHNKAGQSWTGRLVPPFGTASTSPVGFAPDEPLNSVYEPSDRDRSQADNLSTGGRVESKPMRSSVSQGIASFDERKFLDNYARQLAAQEEARRDALTMAVIKSRMRPEFLVEAARAAARQRCLAVADEAQRTACLREANQK